MNLNTKLHSPSPNPSLEGEGIRPAIIALLLSFVICTPALADDNPLETRDWSVNAPQPLGKFQPPANEVKDLANKVLDTDWSMGVCSYGFFDMAHDGAYRLIATLDTNGRHACNRLIVIAKNGKNFSTATDLHVVMVEDINAALQDLNHDGVPELVVPQSWSRYEGDRCLAIVQHIYKWRDGHFTDQSAAFPDIYKARLKDLAAGTAHATDPTCGQMESDKIARLLGNPTAGFDRATEWMKNPDPGIRRKAASVFADIGDESSKKNLAVLAKDDDPLTAESARLYLESPKPE